MANIGGGLDIPPIDEAELFAWLEHGGNNSDSNDNEHINGGDNNLAGIFERDTRDAALELESFFAETTPPPATRITSVKHEASFTHTPYEERPLETKSSRGIYGDASKLYRERKKQKIAAMENQINSSLSEIDALKARVADLEELLRISGEENAALRSASATPAPGSAASLFHMANEEDFSLLSAMQRAAYKELAELTRNPDATDEQFEVLVKKCEEFGGRRVFINPNDFAEILTPRFLMRNAQLNPTEEDCEEIPQRNWADALERWKAVAPRTKEGVVSEAQSQRFFVVRGQYLRKLRALMAERRVLMKRLHDFMIKKIAYNRYMNMLGAEADALTVAQAAQDIASLRQNLRTVNALRHWLRHAMHGIYDARQMAYLYTRSRQWSDATVNALDATVALVTSAEEPEAVAMTEG